MRRLLVLAAFLLTACGSSPATPTAPPDPISALVVQDGDLPVGYHARREPMPWRLYPGIPTTDDVYYREIIGGSDERNEVGHVTVVRYADTATADTAYNAIRAEAEYNKVPDPLGVGEQGSYSGPDSTFYASDVLFRRCNTIVHISIEGNPKEKLMAYAKNLHDRLQPIICS